MKAVAIKMKSYTDIVNNNNLQGRILNFMLLSLGILAFFYVFFIGNIVFNIVERKSLEAEARSLSNEVGDLELVYLSMSNKVDLPLSFSLGFKESKAVYASRKSLSSIGGSIKDKNEI